MKPKIYLIPGTMCNERLWVKLKELGSKEFEFIHIPIPVEDSIDKIVDTIVNQFPTDEFMLLGFSFGGYIASCVAAKIPERVTRLFVISNSPCSLSKKELNERETALKLIGKYGYNGISKGKASSLFDSSSVSDDLVNLVIEMDAEMGLGTLIKQLKIGSERTDLAFPLAKSNIHITFVYSEEDALINKEWVVDFVSNNPKSDALSIPGSGHMLPLEKPSEILDILRRY